MRILNYCLNINLSHEISLQHLDISYKRHMASVNAAGSFYASSDHLQSQKFI
jgi:hypothetical protein